MPLTGSMKGHSANRSSRPASRLSKKGTSVVTDPTHSSWRVRVSSILEVMNHSLCENSMIYGCFLEEEKIQINCGGSTAPGPGLVGPPLPPPRLCNEAAAKVVQVEGAGPASAPTTTVSYHL